MLLLPVLRMSAWQAVMIGSVVTVILAVTLWSALVGETFGAWGIGAGTGVWSIDWAQATADIRVQAVLLAWARRAARGPWSGSATRER